MPNIHPILVHFTIALFTASVLFDIAGWLGKSEALKTAGWWNLAVAAILSVGTVVTGLLAASSLPHTDEIHALMNTHELLGIIVLVVILVLFSWRLIRNGRISQRMLPLYAIVGLVGLGTMFAGGYCGGEMVYRHGMGVTPMMEMMAKEHEHGTGAQAGSHHMEAMGSISEDIALPDSSSQGGTGGRVQGAHGDGASEGHSHSRQGSQDRSEPPSEHSHGGSDDHH